MSTAAFRRYTFKLYPKPAQEESLLATARMCAELWNGLLQRREDVYRRERRSLTAFDLGKEITALRAALPEWAAMPRSIQERVCGDLDNAFKAFFRRAKEGAGRQSGYPRYKPTRSATSIPFREMAKGGWSFHFADEIAGKPATGPCGANPEGKIASSRKGKFPRNSRGRHKAPCGEPANAGEAQAVCQSLSSFDACGEPALAGEAQVRCQRHAGPRPGGEPVNAEEAQAWGGGLPPGKNWRLRINTVPGTIRARGKFPSDPLSIKTGDVMFRDGAWWLSVAVEIDRSRVAGSESMKVELDLIDEFARVERANGECVADRFSDAEAINPPAFSEGCSASGAATTETGAERRTGHLTTFTVEGAATPETGEVLDARQSAMDRKFKRGSRRWKEERARLSKQSAKIARRRREALHRWTTALIGAASDLVVVKPPIKEHTKSPRGDEKSPGAAVEIVSALNRAVLDRAPAMAVQMLEYKAAEAGIECRVVTRDDASTAIGRELVAATKVARRAARKIKEIEV